ARLGRVEAVVPVDELVDGREVPAPGGLSPAARERGRVARVLGGERAPGQPERSLVGGGGLVDLTEPRHVGERAAEGGDVGVRVGPEVAQTLAERPPDQRAPLEVDLEAATLRPLAEV